MRDIDLIPADYRARRELLGIARNYGLIAGLIALLGIAATAVLAGLNQEMTKDIRRLQSERSISDHQRQQLESLREDKRLHGQQHELLTRLRSGTSAREILLAMDTTLGEDEVWFRKWTFKRAMEVLDESQIRLRQQADDEGFFIVIPVGQATEEFWEVRTHMSIDGEAVDHSALSKFVARLYDLPLIEDVKVLQTSLQRDLDMESVKFQLAIVVGPGEGYQNGPY